MTEKIALPTPDMRWACSSSVAVICTLTLSRGANKLYDQSHRSCSIKILTILRKEQAVCRWSVTHIAAMRSDKMSEDGEQSCVLRKQEDVDIEDIVLRP